MSHVVYREENIKAVKEMKRRILLISTAPEDIECRDGYVSQSVVRKEVLDARAGGIGSSGKTGFYGLNGISQHLSELEQLKELFNFVCIVTIYLKFVSHLMEKVMTRL